MYNKHVQQKFSLSKHPQNPDTTALQSSHFARAPTRGRFLTSRPSAALASERSLCRFPSCSSFPFSPDFSCCCHPKILLTRNSLSRLFLLPRLLVILVGCVKGAWSCLDLILLVVPLTCYLSLPSSPLSLDFSYSKPHALGLAFAFASPSILFPFPSLSLSLSHTHFSFSCFPSSFLSRGAPSYPRILYLSSFLSPAPYSELLLFSFCPSFGSSLVVTSVSSSTCFYSPLRLPALCLSLFSPLPLTQFMYSP